MYFSVLGRVSRILVSELWSMNLESTIMNLEIGILNSQFWMMNLGSNPFNPSHSNPIHFNPIHFNPIHLQSAPLPLTSEGWVDCFKGRWGVSRIYNKQHEYKCFCVRTSTTPHTNLSRAAFPAIGYFRAKPIFYSSTFPYPLFWLLCFWPIILSDSESGKPSPAPKVY